MFRIRIPWAARTAPHDEVVAAIWGELCAAVDEPTQATPARVLEELEAYGGNTLANLARGGGVSYTEVAYDGAEALRGWFQNSTYSRENTDACEAFVLGRLGVGDAEVTALIDAVRQGSATRAAARAGWRIQAAALRQAMGPGVAPVALEGAVLAAGQAVGWVAAQVAAAQAARKATEAAVSEAAKRAAIAAAKRAAQTAAQEAAKNTGRMVATAAVPVLNVVFAAMTVNTLAGPALRVTLRAVPMVAMLRLAWRAAGREA